MILGLIGAGFIADYHVEGARAAGGDVRIVAARSRDKAAALAERSGIAEASADWRYLLARPDLEAVIVATPDHTHAEIAIAAALAGKPVLLQKPMARSAAECAAIIAAARGAGTVLEVAFMHRHFEEVAWLRSFLAAGRGGPVLSVRLRNATPGPDWDDWFWSKDKVGGGVVHQIGVHGIDLLQHLFGPIAEVTAVTARRRATRTLRDGRVVTPDNEDHAAALYRMADGLLVSHEISFAESGGTDRFALEVYCADATLHLRGPRGRVAVHGPDGWHMPALPPEAPGARQHREFFDIVAGRRPSTGTAEAGLASLLVAEAIYRSAERGVMAPVAAP